MGDIEQRPSPVDSDDREDGVRVRITPDIGSVSAQEWDACASGNSREALDHVG